MSNLQSIAKRINDAKTSLDRALYAEPALEWLKQYGPRGPVEADVISASIRQNYASACHGSSSAAAYLSRAIQEEFPELTARAIKMAEDDIKAALSALASQERK